MASMASTSSSVSECQTDGTHVTSRVTEDTQVIETVVSPSDPRLLSRVGQKKLSSFPSRQRKKGPAPLASFEDLSMDKTTSDSSSADERNTLPGIGEASEPLSPISPNTKVAALTVPASPRIRVSAASSSSAHDTDSKDSTPDKELFIGYTKKDYCEEMSDVKTSTEELLAEEEKLRRTRERSKQAETEKYEEALKVSKLNRKESSSSVLSENLLPVVSSHSSRLSSVASVGSNIRRSPSPHKMLLETSFCGSKPIQQPSIDLEDPPLMSTRLLDYAMDNLESIKSPTEDRAFSESPTLVPPHFKDSDTSQASGRSTESDSSTPKKSQFQERRDKIDNELSRIHQTSSPRRSTPERSGGPTEHRSRAAEYHMTSEAQKRKEHSESPEHSAKSSRIGKKVLPSQLPDSKELKKTGVTPIPPPPPPGSRGNGASTDASKTKPLSTTPSASPKLGKKYFGKKNKDNAGPGSGASTPSTSRKSSFSSLFRRGDVTLSPVTPDSPGSASGRKSPFSELIKSARNEYRSRSRSRSRSKSRDREFDDESLERKGVLSIFKPKQKRKDDADNRGENEVFKQGRKPSNEAILNVEFTFNSEEGKSPPSTSERQTLKQENIAITKIEKNSPETKISQTETQKEVEQIIAKEVSIKQESTIPTKEVTSPYKTVIEDLEQKQKERAERVALETAREHTADDSVPEKTTSAPLKTIEATKVPAKEELHVKNTREEDSRSESERESEIEYYKKKQQLGIEDDHTASSDVEIKKLVANDNGDDDELPYIPTTLPLERSQVTPMVPVKERSCSLKMVQSIERPRSTTPMLPGRLDQYKESIDNLTGEVESEKMNITIPKKTVAARNVVKQSSKSWEDFCQEGLKSPRTLRREYRENSVHSSEDEFIAPTKQRTKSEGKSPCSRESTPIESSKNWINFEEMPDIIMKPVKQIKTLQQKPMSPVQTAPEPAPRKPRLMSQKRVDTSKMNDVYHSEESQRKSLESQISDEILQSSLRSSTSTPERDDSSEKSSDSERMGSQSSSEELTTIREKIAEIKKREDKPCLDDSSDLERLLAPVNECITKLSNLSIQKTPLSERKSPIPDNWADFLLPPQPGRRSRLSSLGSETGSIGGCRSPSPSHMLLETSFCGSQPIDDPGFAEPNVPIAVARKMSGISLGDLSPLVPRSDIGATASLHHFRVTDQASVLR